MLREGLLTKAGDSYSFGVLLWEMWCGKRAFAGQFPTAVVIKVIQGGHKLSTPEDCPEEVSRLISSCMHEDHTLRPSFDEIKVTLERLQTEFGAK